MKRINIPALLGLVALCGCQSGDISRRTDTSGSAFDPYHTQTEERAKYHSALNPELTESEANTLASIDQAPARKRAKKKHQEFRERAESQKHFEEELKEIFGDGS